MGGILRIRRVNSGVEWWLLQSVKRQGDGKAPARPVHTSAYAAEFPAAQICLSLVIQDRLQQSTTPVKSSCSFLITPCLLTS